MCIRDRIPSDAQQVAGYDKRIAGVHEVTCGPVSYTHLDVYKRQVYHKTDHRLLQNDITCLTDRGSSSTMRTNPGNKMTKRTLTKEQHFFLFSKVEAFGIKFYDQINEAIEQIIKETFSYKSAISINLSEEMYNLSLIHIYVKS